MAFNGPCSLLQIFVLNKVLLMMLFKREKERENNIRLPFWLISNFINKILCLESFVIYFLVSEISQRYHV